MSGCQGCRYHLWVDEAWDPRERRFRRARTPVYGDPAMTCAITVASCGPLDLRTIAAIMGLSHERVRQIEVAALRRLRRRILDRARCTGPGAASPGRCSGPHPAASQPSPSLAGEGTLPQRGDL